MTEYGLPSQRDSEGQLKGVDHTYEWDDEEVTIQLIPPTISQFEEYEDLGEETGAGELSEIVERHVVKPKISDTNLTARELLCYVQGIMHYSTGDSGAGLSEDIQEELDAREGGRGN